MKDIDNFNFCHHVAQDIENAIEGSEKKAEFLQHFLETNQYANSTIENVSSEDIFEQTNKELNIAYDNRNIDKLFYRINLSERKRKIKLIKIISTSSVAAAILIFSFYLFSDQFSTNEKSIEVKSESMKITEPTLIINNNIIKLQNKIGQLNATDYTHETNDKNNNINQLLIIPKECTYNVMLSDSTEVTLNASSELNYPTYFNDTVRNVILKGEAYFNVKKSDKPFIISVNNAYIKVYGTTFNVRYRNDNNLTVVLISGSIGIGSDVLKEVRIKPNQLAELNLIENTCKTYNTDTEIHTGWINGMFSCKNTNLNKLLEDISLWYSVQFNYKTEDFNNVKINISLSRESKLDDVLLFIEKVANIEFIKERSDEYNIKGK